MAHAAGREAPILTVSVAAELAGEDVGRGGGRQGQQDGWHVFLGDLLAAGAWAQGTGAWKMPAGDTATERRTTASRPHNGGAPGLFGPPPFLTRHSPLFRYSVGQRPGRPPSSRSSLWS